MLARTKAGRSRGEGDAATIIVSPGASMGGGVRERLGSSSISSMTSTEAPTVIRARRPLCSPLADEVPGCKASLLIAKRD